MKKNISKTKKTQKRNARGKLAGNQQVKQQRQVVKQPMQVNKQHAVARENWGGRR